MIKTVRDVLAFKGFEKARLVAGEQGLEHMVRGATLMEVPDIFPYLEDDFLLITTLFPIASSKEKLDEFIPRLVNSGVAGICIKPLRYVSEIPPLMLEQANQMAFPIIELPREANLSTLVNLVYSMSLNDYISQIQFRDHVHQILMDLLLGGADIKDLAESLARLLGKTVVLLDKSLGAICAVLPGENGEWSILEDAGAERFTADQRLLSARYMMYPIKAGVNCFGYIFLPEADKDDSEQRMAVEQAAILFATVFYKNNAVAQNQRNFKDVFIRDLLQGKISSEIELENKMKAFDLNMIFPQFVVSLKLFTDNERQKKRFYNDIIDQKVLGKQLSYFYKRDREKNVVYFNDSLVIIEQGDSEQELLEFYTHTCKKLESQAGSNSKIGIGISKAAHGFDVLKTAYSQAVNTVQLGNILHDRSFVSCYSQNSLYDFIQQIPDQELLVKYVRDKLGALISCDRENGTQLMETLHILIQNSFNYKKAAERSFVHYNTIRYRVDKIRQLGFSLEPGRELGELILANDIYIWLKATNKL